MRKKLKIGCIGVRGIPSNYSGIEKACEGLYSEFAKRGHEITVYCRPGSTGDSPKAYRGIRLHEAPAIRTRSLDALSSAGAGLFHAIAFGRFDVLHLHALAPNIFSRFCRAAGVPTVSTVHGLDWQRAKWKGLGAKVLQLAEASMVRNIDQIVVVSQDLQRYYKSRYGRETVYIPNGVELVSESEYEQSTVLREFELSSRGYVLFLGRLVPEKRIEDLIVAYRGMASPWKLVIAGESGFTNAYVASLRSLAAGDPRIVFAGLQEKPAVHKLLQHAALFVSPSALEGLPMALLECMQHGTPAVASDIPAHRELLGTTAGYNLFFPPANVEALRARIELALSTQGECRRIAEQARLFALKMHSWADIADRTEQAFYGALDQSSAGNRTTWKNRRQHSSEKEISRTSPS